MYPRWNIFLILANGLKVHQFLTMISTRREESEENKPFKVLRRTIEVDISDKQDDLIQDKSFYLLFKNNMD